MWTPVAATKQLQDSLKVTYWGAACRVQRDRDGRLHAKVLGTGTSLFAKDSWGLIWISPQPESLAPFPLPRPDGRFAVVSSMQTIDGDLLPWIDHQMDGVHMCFPHAFSVYGASKETFEAASKKVEIATFPDGRTTMTISEVDPGSWILRLGQSGGFVGLFSGIGSLWRRNDFVTFFRKLFFRDLSDAVWMGEAEMLSPAMMKLEMRYRSSFGEKRADFVAALNPISDRTALMAFVIFVHDPLQGVVGWIERVLAAARATRMHITSEDAEFLSRTQVTALDEMRLTEYDAHVLRNRVGLSAELQRLAPLLPTSAVLRRFSVLDGFANGAGFDRAVSDVSRSVPQPAPGESAGA